MFQLRPLLLSLVTTFVLITGCGLNNRDGQKSNSVSGQSVNQAPIVEMKVVAAPTNYHVTKVSTFNTVLDLMSQRLAVKPSAATRGLYDLNKSSLPLTGSEITTGAWMTISAVAGGVCADLIALEKSKVATSRIFFKEIKFGQPNNLSGISTVSPGANKTIYDRIIERLGLALWGRRPSLSESQMISASLGTASLAVTQTLDAANTEVALLFTCSGIAASFEAHEK